MKQIPIYGSPFSHDFGSCHKRPPRRFEWSYRQGDADAHDIEVVCDYHPRRGFHSKSKHKFLWLCESRSITPKQHEDLWENREEYLDRYTAIFTHDRELLAAEPRFRYCPNAANCTWVVDIAMRKKFKRASMVSSGKQMCQGHLDRNRIIDSYAKRYPWIDRYGRSIAPFDCKEQVLEDYMFSVAIENESYSTYYTEKLLDCFACGTVPVYLGSPDIGDRFNLDGIILINDKLDLETLTEDRYVDMLPAIEDNMERCRKEQTADEYLYDRILELV